MIIKNLPVANTDTGRKNSAGGASQQNDHFAEHLHKQVSSERKPHAQQSEHVSKASLDAKKKPVDSKEQQSDSEEDGVVSPLSTDPLALLADASQQPSPTLTADTLQIQLPDTQAQLPATPEMAASAVAATAPTIDTQPVSLSAQIDVSLASSGSGSGMLLPAQDKHILPQGARIQDSTNRGANDAKSTDASNSVDGESLAQQQITPDTHKEGTERPLSFGTSIATAMHNMNTGEHAQVQNVMHSAPVATTAATLPTTLPQPGVASGTLQAEVGTPAWQQSLGQHIAVFTRNGTHQAELRLHPEDLGALQVSLKINNDQAQIHFVAESHQVRSALESAMPHLRTMLAESGIQLGQSSVGADTAAFSGSAQSGDSSGQRNSAQQSAEQNAATEEELNIQPVVVKYTSGINTFA